MIGGTMRNAIEHGGYRAALAYYRSNDAKKSCTSLLRFRTTGWLLGRLGLYDQVQGWLDEAAGDVDLDPPAEPKNAGWRTAYRTPPLWMQTPRPVPLSSYCLMGLNRPRQPFATYALCPTTYGLPC